MSSTEPETTKTVRKRRRKHKIRSDQITDSNSSPSVSQSSLQRTGEEINIDDATPETEALWKIKTKEYFDEIRNGIQGFSYAVVNFLNEMSVDYRQIASQLYSERKDRAKIALELPPVPKDNPIPELSRDNSIDPTTKVF